MEDLGKLGIGIASLAIVLVVTFLIMSQAESQILEIEGLQNTNASAANFADQSAAYNGTVTLAGAVDDIPGWVPIIVITAIGAILIGMVAMFRN